MPEEYTLNHKDITSYVATKQTEDTVGYPRLMHSCLVAESLLWKYPDLAFVEVDHTNEFAKLSSKSGASTTVTLFPDVKDDADRFDRLARVGQPITRQQLEAGMPELFDQKGEPQTDE